jgi:hypothetical protein
MKAAAFQGVPMKLAKRGFVVVTAVFVLPALTLTPGRAESVTVVYPTGIYPVDVEAVQAAADTGGNVLLKATSADGIPTAFNFGLPAVGAGRVSIDTDVAITGERTSGAVTTIEGGSLPFLGQAPVTASISDITFDRPLRGAIWFLAPPQASVAILRNTITNVVGRSFPCCGTAAEAIAVQAGKVSIVGNVIRDIDSQLGIGISVFFSPGPVEIGNNVVTGVNTIGIEATAGGGLVRIVDNTIRPGAERDPRRSAGTGIEVNGTAAYYVARNDIVTNQPSADGIFLLGTEQVGFGPLNGPVVEHNRITAQASDPEFSTGVVLGGIVTDAYIGQNTIAGGVWAALAAVSLVGFEPASDIARTTFIGNNLARADAHFADVFLDDVVHDSVLKGKSGEVIDLGKDNAISGFSRRTASGEQVAAATQHRNERRAAAHLAKHSSP